MLIQACVSSHGFGHGSRTASVLRALHQRRPAWSLVVSTGLSHAFLDSALAGVPHQRRHCRWDVGVIQADALSADPAATLAALEQLERDLPQRLEAERRWLAAQGQPVALLADVPPAAVRLARAIEAPLIWLASFGWDSIYAAMGEPFAAWTRQCLDLYRQGDLLLRCPLALPMAWGLPEVQLGLTTAPPALPAAAVRQRLQLPAEAERCVLIGFGGLGLELDPRLLGRWPQWTFIGADPVLAKAANGRQLPPGWRPLDVMPCCARVLTKPGYSTFCEALSQDLGIHLVHREGFAEAAMLEQALIDHGPHRLLSQSQLHQGDWQLDQPLLPPRRGPLPRGGAEQAAAAIVEWLEAGRS